MKSRKFYCLCVALAVFARTHSAPAQGTAFTYQGTLNANGGAASGSFDLTFALYPTNSGGVVTGSIQTNLGVTVANGLFTATLDFGNVFDGKPYWLEIGVRSNSSTGFTILTPRQQVNAIPYAITASNLSGKLPVNQLNGTLLSTQLPASVLTNNSAGVTLNGSFNGNISGSANSLTGYNSTNLLGRGFYGAGLLPFYFTGPPGNGADSGLIFYNFNSEGSGAGIGWASSGTNALNPLNGFSLPQTYLSVNPDGSSNNVYDMLGSQMIMVPANAPHTDLPSRIIWVQNPYQDFSICAAFSDGTGNKSYMQSEQTKGLLHFTRWFNGMTNLLPQDAGYTDAAVLDLYNGNLTITNNISAGGTIVTHGSGGFVGNGGGLTNIPESAIVNLSSDLANALSRGAAMISTNGFIEQLKTEDADYTLAASDSVILINGNGLTMTLPNAASIGAGKSFTLKLVAPSTTATVITLNSQTIDGAPTYSLSAQYKYLCVVSDGTQYLVVGSN